LQVKKTTTICYYFCDKKVIDTRSQTSSPKGEGVGGGCNPLHPPPGSTPGLTLHHYCPWVITTGRHHKIFVRVYCVKGKIASLSFHNLFQILEGVCME